MNRGGQAMAQVADHLSIEDLEQYTQTDESGKVRTATVSKLALRQEAVCCSAI